jgi:hypothetical protein
MAATASTTDSLLTYEPLAHVEPGPDLPPDPARSKRKQRGLRWPRPLGPAAVLSVFALSRVLAAQAGVRFDASQLAIYWQFADPKLLKSHLLGTVFYLHIEPPLFNLFLGTVLRWSPFSATASFHLVYLVLGAALTLGLYDLARQLGASRRVAVTVTVLITCSPATLLYENFLFYEYPVALGLVAMAVALVRWVRTGSLLAYGVFAVAGAAIVLTRSLFHPIWFIGMLVLALVARPGSTRRPTIIGVSAGVLLVIGAVVLKNVVLFDSPGLSSWVGMNVAETTIQQIPPADRAALIRQGVLSPLAAQLPWEPYDTYRGLAAPCQPHHAGVGIGVLNTKARPSGATNFNYECYLPLFRQYQRDSLAAALHRPADVLRGQVDSWQLSFAPATKLKDLDGNRTRLRTLNDVYRRAVYLEVVVPRAARSPNPRGDPLGNTIPLSVTVLVAFAVVLGRGGHHLRRWVTGRRGRFGAPLPGAVLEVFIAVTMLWTFVVSNAVEFGQNERFRYVVEPLMLLVLARTVDQATRWLWQKGHA